MARLPRAKSAARILVVDDEPDLASIISKYFGQQRIASDAFTKPHDAIQHLLGRPDDYSLALVDVRMPGMSGFEFVRQVHEINPDIKIVMMTAFEIDLSEFTTVFPSTKIDGLIKKPFSMSDLLAVISKHVAQKKGMGNGE